MQHLRPIGLFVGNGLDRSVLPYQKHDVTRKPRAVRRDFMRCAQPAVRRGQDTRPTLLLLVIEVDDKGTHYCNSNEQSKLKQIS